MLFMAPAVYGQDAETMAVQHTIERFFEGFHEQDTMKIKATTGKGIVLQTISRKNDGNNEVRTDVFSEFLKSIASIPDSVGFREEIGSYQIKIDGPMANAWTPYKFWLNDTFSHCGVNSFQLAKVKDGWKIIYLIDTRRKEDCP
jgi:hypothetical protein